MNWITLIISLPTDNAAARMRIWRAVKASGAAALRDGVYLLPKQETCLAHFNAVMADVQSVSGTAYLLKVDTLDDSNFSLLFNREPEFAALLVDITQLRDKLSMTEDISDVIKQIRKLRKTFNNIADIDFFPGEAQKQVDATLQELEQMLSRRLSPDEPQAVEGAIQRLQIQDYQGRIWATRRRPRVDRLACAWLIQSFIDQQARILWLDTPADCPEEALGFDFDGATFSHVGARISFEVLLASFNLEQPALKRIAALVHYLDVGGIQPPEANGVESVLTGLHAAISDDDQLLNTASHVFDGLLTAFNKQVTS